MALGERLKMARQMAGLSQRELAERVGVSAMAISKYENGKMMPDSPVLIRLSKALGVRIAFFMRSVSVSVSVPAFRCRPSLKAKDQKMILGETQDWLERYLEISSFFHDTPVFSMPDITRRIAALDAVEQVAARLREAWNLGLDPIDNFVEVLEEHGIKVGVIAGVDDFDALTLWVKEQMPVMVVKETVPGDRQRFSLAHELGHLILDPCEGLDEEKAANRFAGAFLVPQSMAIYELGAHRQTLDLYELHLLKHKYGVSMQTWMHRAEELGIISQAHYDRLVSLFKQKGWRVCEPGDQVAPEQPGRMKRLVLRALAEGVISQSRAAELLGKPLAQFWREEAEHHDGFPVTVRH